MLRLEKKKGFKNNHLGFCLKKLEKKTSKFKKWVEVRKYKAKYEVNETKNGQIQNINQIKAGS